MKLWLMFVVAFMPLFVKANDICTTASARADTEGAIISTDKSGYKVTGKGRAYFYSAPDEHCITKNLFIVPGDLVNASLDYEEYKYIIYFTKKGKDVSGWVKSSRLAPTGTGIGPSRWERGE